MGIVNITVLAFLVLLPFLYIGWAVYQLKKDSLKIRRVWDMLDKFDQYSIKVGLLLLIPVPILKSSVYNSDYLIVFLIELLPAVATGFFVNGVIAYAKAMHAYNSGNNT